MTSSEYTTRARLAVRSMQIPAERLIWAIELISFVLIIGIGALAYTVSP